MRTVPCSKICAKFGIMCKNRVRIINFGIRVTAGVQDVDHVEFLDIHTLQCKRSTKFGIECRDRGIINLRYASIMSAKHLDNRVKGLGSIIQPN